MNESEKKQYLEKYKKAKDEGVPFYPNILFKDAVIALLVFLVLIGIAYFVGAPLESRANPADSSYTPRPEWYFTFLFQLLKYFPGKLEVLGVIVIPGIVIALLFLLPLLDKNPRRHLLNRPWISGITSFLVLGIVTLTILSYLEAPPPAEEKEGDPVAALYTENCATCHGPSISVPEGIDLHNVIAQGTHIGMPAWSGDLDTNEIDALAGFITSPGGNDLYNQYCLDCHQISDLVASNQIELRDSLELGVAYLPHEGVEVPVWKETLTSSEITDLLNFLVAPDGQRLFTVNCSSCHGKTVAYSGDEGDLQEIISQGGLHLEMPSWQGSLSSEELDMLSGYVTDPTAYPESEDLYNQNCSSCHGGKIPVAADFNQAREIIASGGSHETMPVWGDVLTNDQLEALTSYTWDAAQGTPLELGQNLFGENCAFCHGTFGEGGQNPARPGDVIAPISSGEYLSTRDNITLYNIISQGQPNFGMSPFGNESGGPLSGDQIDSIISYMRTWELNPPVELPPEVQTLQDINLSGQQIFDSFCSQCHQAGDTAAGPPLGGPDFQANTSDEDIFDSIKNGHPTSAMIAFGSLLTDGQIQELIEIIRQLEPDLTESTSPPPALPSFTNDILPVLEAECIICHGSLGGWNGSNYDSVINSGDNGPAVVPGDAENSLLAQKLLDTQETGAVMPPAGKLADEVIQLFLNWIKEGAPNN